MAKIKVGPGTARSRFANGRPKNIKSASAMSISRASSGANKNPTSSYNTGASNAGIIKKPANLTSKINASKPVTKKK